MNNVLSKTILIADDDDGNYYLLKHYLSEFNCNVIRAMNGLEAVNIFKERPDIDLVFMDMRMPVMNGMEASKIIQEINSKIPIIIITAFAYDNTELEKFKTVCNKVETKPITVQKIDALFSELLN